MSRDSAHGMLLVKGFPGFEHPIREMHQFPHGGAHHHHAGLPARTQALPEGAKVCKDVCTAGTGRLSVRRWCHWLC
jgi:hypothetical protein